MTSLEFKTEMASGITVSSKTESDLVLKPYHGDDLNEVILEDLLPSLFTKMFTDWNVANFRMTVLWKGKKNEWHCLGPIDKWEKFERELSYLKNIIKNGEIP